MPTIQDSRILIKSSTVSGQVPTVPTSNDHTDGSWLVTDIYRGELFINQADNKVYIRTASGIVQIYPASSTPIPQKVTNSTTIALLQDDSNWTNNNYTGVGITGQNEGDWYDNGSIRYLFITATTVSRIPYLYL